MVNLSESKAFYSWLFILLQEDLEEDSEIVRVELLLLGVFLGERGGILYVFCFFTIVDFEYL